MRGRRDLIASTSIAAASMKRRPALWCCQTVSTLVAIGSPWAIPPCSLQSLSFSA